MTVRGLRNALRLASVVIDEFGVVEAQQVQERGLEVVGRDHVLGGLVADLVGGAVGRAGLMPPPASQQVKP